MNRPRIRLPEDSAQLLTRQVFPVLKPWDPLRLRLGQQVAIYLRREYRCEARLLQAIHLPNLYALPDLACYWLCDAPFPRREHLRLQRYYEGILDLERTPFGFYIFERLPKH